MFQLQIRLFNQEDWHYLNFWDIVLCFNDLGHARQEALILLDYSVTACRIVDMAGKIVQLIR
jgi:hypothetical protein